MMLPYPFNPFYYRRPYPYYASRKPINNFNQVNEKISCSPISLPKEKQENFECFSNNLNNKKSVGSNLDCNTSEEYFEIFGLKLYFDDLLIIALLFFLYQEDVKDTYLYIALILLLLS